jgi:hypothetical protein
MGNKGSTEKPKMKVRGYARPKGELNPMKHGFWIDDSLLSHPQWKDMKEVPGRKKKLSKKEEQDQVARDQFAKGWAAAIAAAQGGGGPGEGSRPGPGP